MLRARMRAASFTQGGQDWRALFARFDADGSGTLEVRKKRIEETRRAQPTEPSPNPIAQRSHLVSEPVE
jgi:hypothetical protein